MKRAGLFGWTLVVVLMLGRMPGLTYAQATTETRITVNCAKDAGELDHFWTMSGFDHEQLGFPHGDSQWALDSDQRQQLIYVGSLPHGGVTHTQLARFMLSGTLEARHRAALSHMN